MLRVALEDPLNQRFLLVSEVCIPLYPPTVMYAQLMGEDKSRLNACAKEGWHTQSERSAPCISALRLGAAVCVQLVMCGLLLVLECLCQGGLAQAACMVIPCKFDCLPGRGNYPCAAPAALVVSGPVCAV